MSEGIGAAAVRGVYWTGLGQVVRQIVQVVGSIALARLLVPDDFGLVGMAMVFIGIGQLLSDFGIGSAIVQARSDDRVVLSSCFWLNVGVAAAVSIVMLAASPLISSLYKRTDLVPLLAVLSSTILLAGLQAVPSALLYRDMRFAAIARAQVLGSLAGAMGAVWLAWLGAGIWALAAQPLIGSSVSLLVSLIAARWRPQMTFSWAGVAPLARFSFALLGTNLVGYMNRNVDSLLVGRFLGASPLGVYSMAVQLMLYPLQQVSSVIVRVLFPTLVQLRHDVPRMRAAYLKAVAAIAVITFPMMGGLFAVADDFVAVVFGPSWTDMSAVLKVMAWVGMVQSLSTTVGTLYLTMGEPGQAFRVTALGFPVLVGCVAAGLPFGILGVAVGYAVATLLIFFYVTARAFRLVDLRFAEFIQSVHRPFIATVAMIALVVFVIAWMGNAGANARLIASIVAGGLVYITVSLVINRAQLSELIKLAMSARQRP